MTAQRAAAVAAALSVAAACTGSARGRHAVLHTVEIRGFAYVPPRLELATGDTVVWINRDIVPHTVTREGGGWDSHSMASQGTWRVVVGRADAGSYYCTFHPTMRGTLAVRS